MKNTLQAEEIVYETPCVGMKNRRIKKTQWPERRAVGDVHYEAWQAGLIQSLLLAFARKTGLLKPEKSVSGLHHGTACCPLLQSAQIQPSPQMTSKWLPPSTAFHLVFLRQGFFLDPELTKWLSWLTSKLQDLLVCLRTSASGFRGFEWRSSCLPSMHFTN